MNFNDALGLSFNSPKYLLGIAAVVLCLLVCWFSSRVQLGRMQRLIGGPLAPAERRDARPQAMALVRWAVAMGLVVLALADPRIAQSSAGARRINVQIVFALDRSRSMLCNDIPESPSRLKAAVSVVTSAITAIEGAAVAITSFADDSRVDIALTRDWHATLRSEQRVTAEENVPSGTNLVSGLRGAMRCFAWRIDSPKLLIVLTDGEVAPDQFNWDEMASVENVARGFSGDTKVMIVGVGDPTQAARIPLRDGSFLQHQGQTVFSQAQPEFIESLAQKLDTAEVCWVANKSDISHASDRVAAIVEEMNHASQSSTLQEVPTSPLFHWLALLAIGLLFIIEFQLLGNSRKSRRNTSQTSTTNNRLRGLALLVSLLMVGANMGANLEPSHRSYRELVMQYNSGVAAFHEQRWKVAEAHFEAGLKARDSGVRARSAFNLGNTLFYRVNEGGISKPLALAELNRAIEQYHQCIAWGHRITDARFNIAIVRARIDQIERQPPEPADDQVQESAQSKQQQQPSASDAAENNRPQSDQGNSPEGSQGGESGNPATNPSDRDRDGVRPPAAHNDQQDQASSPTSQAQGELTADEVAENLDEIRNRADERESAEAAANDREKSSALRSNQESEMPW